MNTQKYPLIRKALIAFIPYGIVAAVRRQKQKKKLAAHAEYLAERNARILATKSKEAPSNRIDASDNEAVIDYLASRGIDRDQVIFGSIPHGSLMEIERTIRKYFDGSHALKALHIGNFLGVSLASITKQLTSIHKDSLVVSIDPNLTHRNISNPQNHVAALLSACGLQSNTMIIAGYSGKKSISNDGIAYSDEYDPAVMYDLEFACENTLANLAQLSPGTFDIVLMDGNHEGEYLANELSQVLPLLKSDALVILDDVEPSWSDIEAVFSSITKYGLKAETADGRIGIAVRGFTYNS